jgi:hypothetical protein
MFLGLKFYTSIPAWILATASFVLAVFIVAFLEVIATESRYLLFKKRLKKGGFQLEEYFETRFFIDKAGEPEKILKKIAKEFGLHLLKRIDYNDLYIESNLKEYSGRKPKVRFRNRGRGKEGLERMRTFQIVYTRPRERLGERVEQFRFFPIKKEKLYYFLNKSPNRLKDIQDNRLIKILRENKCNKEIGKISFSRLIARNNDLLVSVDKIRSKRNVILLELKTHKNTKLLIKSMRYVMKEFPVIQTTYGKIDLELL